MQHEITYNPDHALLDVTITPAPAAAPILLGAAQTWQGAEVAAAAVRAAGGRLAAGWAALARDGGTPNSPLTVRGASWPHAVRRHQDQRRVAVEGHQAARARLGWPALEAVAACAAHTGKPTTEPAICVGCDRPIAACTCGIRR